MLCWCTHSYVLLCARPCGPAPGYLACRVLILSQYVEQLYARELLADQAGGVGYLLKDRVFNDEAFTAAIRTVAAGGTVLDPEVVGKLMTRRSRAQAGGPADPQGTRGARAERRDGPTSRSRSGCSSRKRP